MISRYLDMACIEIMIVNQLIRTPCDVTHIMIYWYRYVFLYDVNGVTCARADQIWLMIEFKTADVW
jgi:hypothetical protein